MSNIEYPTSNDQCERIDETKDGGDQVIRKIENIEYPTAADKTLPCRKRDGNAIFPDFGLAKGGQGGYIISGIIW